MIRYTAEQLLHVNRSTTLVPTICYMRPEGNPDFRFHKLNVLNENIKRVYLAARPMTSEKQQAPGRNRWVILLETVAGNGMSVELNQIDSEGNTIVMVRPRSIKLVDEPGSFHYGQVSGFAYSKDAELTTNLDVRSFFNRVEGFGLSRYKLQLHSSPEKGLFDYRGHRFWIWSVLRILEPELPGFIPDHTESPLVSIMFFNASSAKADLVRNGHFLSQKQKRHAPARAPCQNIPAKCPTPSSPGFSGVTLPVLQEDDVQGNIPIANSDQAIGFPVQQHQPSADVSILRHANVARELGHVFSQVQRYITPEALGLQRGLLNAPGMEMVAEEEEEEEEGHEENTDPVWLRRDEDVGAYSRNVAFSDSSDDL
ncbi:hypothetical protein PG990_001075 [Apiospora arundinis]